MRFVILVSLVLFIHPFLSAQPDEKYVLPDLIPQPVSLKGANGFYVLKSKITVSNSLPAHEWPGLYSYFREEMKKLFNITVTEAAKGQQGDIAFRMQRMPTSGKPAYELEVGKEGIFITSNFAEPAFHAMQTLFQLIPSPPQKKEIPRLKIFDHARFEYRGMHLDVSRHFFPVAFIKRYIDYLAHHKLNRFHWHLTDDQGWRIQVKKYPRLTSAGAWRNGTILARYPGNGSDNTRYGGFYTQEEIKEVVKYAQERFIEVIPEIEMPGHSSAAIAAYPGLSCFPGKPTHIPPRMISQKSVAEQNKGRIKLVQETWGVFDDVFCAGNDSTFLFLQNVIDEVAELFPSKYFHIGGDESPKTHWKICPKCQQRIKDLNLKDEHELQSYFVQRIEKHLNSKSKTLIGWDEILEGGLAPNAIVMSWRGETGGIEAAKQKHPVIMTPGNPVYFDHSQSDNEDSVTIGGYNPIEKVYAYEPIPKELSEEEGKYVLGAQANVWTEYIKTPRKAEYMIFPRMAALSEVLWSPEAGRNWNDFEKKLPAQFRRYDLWGANYSKTYYELKTSVLPAADFSGVLCKIDSKKLKEGESVFYSEDTVGGDKWGKWIKYSEPIKIQSGYLTAFKVGSDAFDKTIFYEPKTLQFHFNKATGKKIILTNPASGKYPGDGAFTLVNGVINAKGLGKSREFLGFEGADCELVIDLGAKMEFKEIVVYSFTQIASWIYPPRSTEFTLSDDGINFRSADTTVFSDIEPYMKRKSRMRGLHDEIFSARYIKIFIRNYGIIPQQNPGGGNKPWLFLDEIEVN